MKKYLIILPFLMLASCSERPELTKYKIEKQEENLNKTLPVGCSASYKGWHNFDGTLLPIVVVHCKDKSAISINASRSAGKTSRSAGKSRTNFTTLMIED